MAVASGYNPWDNYRYIDNYFPINIFPCEKRIFHKREEDKMTLLMAFHVSEGILIASDSRGTNKNTGTFKDSKKVTKLCDFFGVCSTGLSQINASIIQDFKQIITKDEYKDQDENFKIWYCNVARKYLERISICQNPNPTISFDHILGGYVKNTPVIYSICYNPMNGLRDLYFNREEGEIVAVGGVGQLESIHYDYFLKKYPKIMDIENTIPIIEEGIENISKQTFYVGGEPQIAKITENGFEWIEKPDWITE